jgi:hypothetical protein
MLENAEKLQEIIDGNLQNDAPLKVCFLFENETTRAWARESAEEIKCCAGGEAIQATWWRMNELSEAGVLAGAVSTAMRAHLVVIATEETEGLPLPFYVWMNGWTSNRRQSSGAILSLSREQKKKSSRGGRLAKYLRSAAEQAKLEIACQNFPAANAEEKEEITR